MIFSLDHYYSIVNLIGFSDHLILQLIKMMNIIDLQTYQVLPNIISVAQSPSYILVLKNNDIVVSTYTSNFVNIIKF